MTDELKHLISEYVELDLEFRKCLSKLSSNKIAIDKKVEEIIERVGKYEDINIGTYISV